MRLWYVFGANYNTMSVIHSIPYKIKDTKDPTHAKNRQLSVYKKLFLLNLKNIQEKRFQILRYIIIDITNKAFYL